MNLSDDSEDDVIREIYAAFPAVRRDGGIGLHEAEEIDNYGGAEERARAREMDVEPDWQHVPTSAIESMPSALYFLDATGFAYYLPAVMVWSVRHADGRSDSSTPDSLLSLLGEPDRQRWCEELLTPAQLRVIARFIRYMERVYYHGRDGAPGLRQWEQRIASR